ncbi:unnamed protein product [Rotaria sordida]|uniref:Histidine-specific methyltransferase SAM-dependent domain-containing protein n=1 Tax=Rotaria sordida TaxID=392033 RepID=A0A815VLX3_9BILA|nr:unnamed protein product [Rotaria sordida]CAF1536937.1 unnamed protein product [Rotaria sordida]
MDQSSKYANEEIELGIQDWCKEFNRVWIRSDWIFSMLRSTEDYYKQPIKLRLPFIFYLGHLPCFSWAQFRHLNDVNGIINKTFDDLFLRDINSDVETNIVKHSHSTEFSTDTNVEEEYWRSFTVQSVIDYKNNVRVKLIDILTNSHLDLKDIKTLNVLNISAEHEMLYQETLMYLFVHLPIESLRWNFIHEHDFLQHNIISSLPSNTWIMFPGGQTSLGKPYNDDVSTFSFGWDNEFPREFVYLPVFEMQSHPIRNGDFLQFILDNGYTTSDWWDENVFTWIIKSNIRSPSTWIIHENSYQVNFVLQRNIPIECVLDHPVLVSQVEAKAYCQWISKKTGEQIELPTEAEWIYALWDSSNCIRLALKENNCNIDFHHLHTIQVSSNNNEKLQWQGSAFEWTSSVFRPFSGYQGPLSTYPGYSADFFDNCHFVLLGGSFATDSTFIRRTFRNWYQDTYRYVFATFRCVKRVSHTDDKLTQIDRDAIVASLSNTEHRKISSKYFYDAQGSAIYTKITQLDEYYPFRQELKLLCQKANDIKSTIIHHSNFQNHSSSTIHFIELGCGDGKKVEAWLTPWINSTDNISIEYHPVDISQHAIDSLVQLLKQTFNENIIEQYVKPLCSTFENMYEKINTNIMGIKVVILMGSTIGNFSSYDEKNVKYGEDAPVIQLLRSIRQNLNVGDWFICAFDMCKDTTTMIRAYSDSKGVTTAFNMNLLSRLNRELNFNFNLNNYQHYALYNPLRRQMESWLICLNHETITDHQGFTMQLQPYNAIQTELSTKYTREDIELLMKKNSMKIIEFFNSDDHRFPYCLCLAQII